MWWMRIWTSSISLWTGTRNSSSSGSRKHDVCSLHPCLRYYINIKEKIIYKLQLKNSVGIHTWFSLWFSVFPEHYYCKHLQYCYHSAQVSTNHTISCLLYIIKLQWINRMFVVWLVSIWLFLVWNYSAWCHPRPWTSGAIEYLPHCSHNHIHGSLIHWIGKE